MGGETKFHVLNQNKGKSEGNPTVTDVGINSSPVTHLYHRKSGTFSDQWRVFLSFFDGYFCCQSQANLPPLVPYFYLQKVDFFFIFFSSNRGRISHRRILFLVPTYFSLPVPKTLPSESRFISSTDGGGISLRRIIFWAPKLSEFNLHPLRILYHRKVHIKRGFYNFLLFSLYRYRYRYRPILKGLISVSADQQNPISKQA